MQDILEMRVRTCFREECELGTGEENKVLSYIFLKSLKTACA